MKRPAANDLMIAAKALSQVGGDDATVHQQVAQWLADYANEIANREVAKDMGVPVSSVRVAVAEMAGLKG